MRTTPDALRSRAASAVKGTAAGRALLVPMRWWTGHRYVGRQAATLRRWSVRSREYTNFTYDLTPANRRYLAETVALVCDAPVDRVLELFDELDADTVLRDHVATTTAASPYRHVSDDEAHFGSRPAWYALVRLRRPSLVVETGVDKGLGACVLGAALLRNAEEGRPGRYVGLDLNPTSGWLFGGPYAEVGEVRVDDAVAGIAALDGPIDLLISETAAGRALEEGERRAAGPLLAPDAVVVAAMAHTNTSLAEWADATGRRFVAHREEPADHWHPGVTTGFAWPRPVRPEAEG